MQVQVLHHGHHGGACGCDGHCHRGRHHHTCWWWWTTAIVVVVVGFVFIIGQVAMVGCPGGYGKIEPSMS